jgi:hypothetical protein
MTISAKLVDVDELKARLLRLAGPDAFMAIKAANQKNAQEFASTVARVIPRGDERAGHLVDTLRQSDYGDLGAQVEIGGAGTGYPYPAHLEWGHRNKDGSHTPGKPFWFPAKVVIAKRARLRVLRAQRALIKSVAATGATEG